MVHVETELFERAHLCVTAKMVHLPLFLKLGLQLIIANAIQLTNNGDKSL